MLVSFQDRETVEDNEGGVPTPIALRNLPRQMSSGSTGHTRLPRENAVSCSEVSLLATLACLERMLCHAQK